MTSQPGLKRVLSLPQMVLYGLGTTIGAGIYALVGELAGVAGYAALAAFVMAALMAALTAFSFAELSGRLPQAAGAAVYVRAGFGSPHFSTLIGLLVIAAGLVSSAALVNALVEQLAGYWSVPRVPAITVLVLVLGALAMWGIAESVTVAGLVTLVEVGGLLAVVWVGRGALYSDSEAWAPLWQGFLPLHWGAVGAGALLAFYAFIGFEDMVVVAEEVKAVERTLPLAILITLLATVLLYLSIMSVALLTFTPQQLSQSSMPLIDIYHFHQGSSAWVIQLIALFAITNGVLIQTIMAARVLYGLASRGQLPGWLAQISPRTRTPLPATALATVTILLLALMGRLASLAELTSVIMLLVFASANLALWRIKGRPDDRPPRIHFPRWMPLLGFLVSLGFVVGFVVDYCCR